MKKKSIEYIRDYLAKIVHGQQQSPVGFNMGVWHDDAGYTDHTKHKCGTTACLGGWAGILLRKDGRPRSKPLWDYDAGIYEAEKRLGLDHWTASDLFFMHGLTCYTPEDINVHQAVKCLDHLLKTGRVDWNKATA